MKIEQNHCNQSINYNYTIRSYVLRAGRLTCAQERAIQELWSYFGIDWEIGQKLDLIKIFGNDHPVMLEIGFGNGETLAELALQNPAQNWLGIEVHRPGIGHLLLELERREITNLHIIHHDAVEVLAHGIAPASFTMAQLLFPDPWPKRRHHKRRLVNLNLLKLLAQALIPSGIVRIMTDWQPYADQILEILKQTPDLFENISNNQRFSVNLTECLITRFERRAIQRGNPCWELILKQIV